MASMGMLTPPAVGPTVGSNYGVSADAAAVNKNISTQKAIAAEKAARAAGAARAAAAAKAKAKPAASMGMLTPPAVGPVVDSGVNWGDVGVAALQGAVTGAAAAPPPVQYRTSGSGRSTAQIIGGGGAAAPAPAVFTPPESVTAQPAVTQPPAVIAQAAPSETNVPGESFTTVGSPGSFGAYERRRSSRGPLTGLSVTPEMIRRAAAARLG